MSKPAADNMRHITGPEEFAAAFDVSRETLDRLKTYEQLVRQWQKAVNLVAPSTLDDIWHRHFADSAQIVALAPDAASWIDLGSGGGFPGLVVAILMAGRERAEPFRITLVESDTRKSAFLREVARKTGVAVDILSTRIEIAATQDRVAAPQVVSARALAPLDRLLGLAAPLSSPATVGLFLKGREAAAEVEAARRTWTFTAEMVPSITEPSGRIIVVRDLAPKAKD